MLSVNPISFCGKTTRQYNTKFDFSAGKTVKCETTRDEFIKSYDSQIAKIQKYKKFALKLDDLMFNDKDIQKAVKELPDDVEIEVAANFSRNDNFDSLPESEIELNNPVLLASTSLDKTEKGSKLPFLKYIDSMSISCLYTDKGPNKEMILDWLENLKSFYE